jgi:hypothetical protein
MLALADYTTDRLDDFHFLGGGVVGAGEDAADFGETSGPM